MLGREMMMQQWSQVLFSNSLKSRGGMHTVWCCVDLGYSRHTHTYSHLAHTHTHTLGTHTRSWHAHTHTMCTNSAHIGQMEDMEDIKREQAELSRKRRKMQSKSGGKASLSQSKLKFKSSR